MAYTHTNISLETSLDVLDKYNQLINASADGNSLYIRAREVVEQLKQDNLITSADEGTIIAQTVAQLSGSASAAAMSTALQWSAKEKDLVLQKEETEYKIDSLKLANAKAEFDRDSAEALKIYTQAKTIREMGKPVLLNGNVVSLPDEGKEYQLILGLAKDLELKEVQKTNYTAQTKQVQAQVHKLVADTYINHGMFTGYTISENGIINASRQAQPFVTLSEMNRYVAREQARGYALNAWGNAASSSAGMIGTLVAAEIANEPLVNSSIALWQTSVGKLNAILAPEITI